MRLHSHRIIHFLVQVYYFKRGIAELIGTAGFTVNITKTGEKFEEKRRSHSGKSLCCDSSQSWENTSPSHCRSYKRMLGMWRVPTVLIFSNLFGTHLFLARTFGFLLRITLLCFLFRLSLILLCGVEDIMKHCKTFPRTDSVRMNWP